MAAPSGDEEAMLVEQLASSKAGTGMEERGRGEMIRKKRKRERARSQSDRSRHSYNRVARMRWDDAKCEAWPSAVYCTAGKKQSN